MMIPTGVVTVEHKQKGGPCEGKPTGHVGYSTNGDNSEENKEKKLEASSPSFFFF